MPNILTETLKKFFTDPRTDEVRNSDKLGSTPTSLVQQTDSVYDTRCIALISNIVAKSTLGAYKMTNNGPEPVTGESETLLLLNNPAPGKSLGDLLSAFTKNILIHNRFWALYDQDINVIYVLNPANIEYETKNGVLDKVKNGNKELPVESILLAQANGTEDDWSATQKGANGSRKFADLEALYTIENSSRLSAQARMTNRSAIDGIFTTEPDVMVTEEQRDEIEEGLVTRYRGTANSGKPFFSPGLRYQETGTSNTSVEYVGYIEQVKKELLAYRGVPELLLTNTSVSTNYSSNQALRGMFQSVINPMIELFNEMVNIQLVPQIEPDVFIDYTDQTPEDVQELQKTLSEMYQNGSISLNEYRVPLGLLSVPNGNTLIDGTEVPETDGVKNIIEVLQNKERGKRIHRTVLKQKKIEREVEEIKKQVIYEKRKNGRNTK